MGVEFLLFVPAAFLAGVLMFLAPCTLPIVPGYLAFIAGGQGKVVRNAFAFVLGFSVVFILLGTFAGYFGSVLAPFRGILSALAGILLILFGITMLGIMRLPFLSGERHIGIPRFLALGRPESSLLIGALFAVGWSPCIGPILGTILLLASSSSTAGAGAFLLAIFSLGLAIPFMLCAIFLEKANRLFPKLDRFSHILSVIGGVILIAIGLLMATGNMGLLIAWGFSAFDFLEYERLLQYL